MIYLDNAATTPPDPRVIDVMAEAMRERWHNPGAAYTAAGAGRRTLRQARQSVAALLNADPQEILFNSGGTEGNNHALTLATGGHAVVSAIEHSSVLSAARLRCREVTLIKPDERGVIRPEAVKRAMRPDTKLVSVMLANNETGVLQPVREIADMAKRHGVPMHCDAVQAAGHIPVDVKALGVDLLTLSAHKFNGPRGIGALYVRQGVPLSPMICGGGQEFGLRSGTENLPAIEGLRVACDLALLDMDARAGAERDMLDAFGARLTSSISGCRLLGEGAPRLPGLRALLLPGLSAERAIAELDGMGIQLSGGAACAALSHAPSHVYTAMGLTPADALCVLRVSVGRSTTPEELEAAADAIEAVYRRCHGV